MKADKKGNLKEVATLANYLGELLAKIGEIQSDVPLSVIDDSNVIFSACAELNENNFKAPIMMETFQMLFISYNPVL